MRYSTLCDKNVFHTVTLVLFPRCFRPAGLPLDFPILLFFPTNELHRMPLKQVSMHRNSPICLQSRHLCRCASAPLYAPRC